MNNRLLPILLVALVASGCSREKAEGGASAAKAPTAAPAEAVAAVLQSGGTPIAKLGFIVVTRPVVGAQSELRLEILAAAAVPALQVRIEADALTIDPSTAQVSVSLEAGKTLSHQVKFTPQREGLTEVTVRLKSEEDSETVYVIPVEVAATTGGA
ncbi:MAG: hypothetical protein ABI645_11315 [Pseudomonadota bacterium]